MKKMERSKNKSLLRSIICSVVVLCKMLHWKLMRERPQGLQSWEWPWAHWKREGWWTDGIRTEGNFVKERFIDPTCYHYPAFPKAPLLTNWTLFASCWNFVVVNECKVEHGKMKIFWATESKQGQNTKATDWFWLWHRWFHQKKIKK